jgi:hypothetical protein
MDEVLKPTDPDCYTLSSDPFRYYAYTSYKEMEKSLTEVKVIVQAPLENPNYFVFVLEFRKSSN